MSKRIIPVLSAFSVFSSCALSLLVVMPAVPAAAEVANVGLTPAQTRALFGDVITGTYYDPNTGDYEGCTFIYSGQTTVNYTDIRQNEQFSAALDDVTSTPFLIYSSDIYRPVSNSEYYTVRLSPVINLGMLNEFHMIAGFSSPATQDENGNWVSGVLEPIDLNRGGYPYNNWQLLQNGNIVGGDSADRWALPGDIGNWLCWGIAGTSQSNRRFFVPNIINLYSESYFSVSSLTITRQGNGGATLSANSRINLYISCPHLSQTYTDNNNGGSGGGTTGTDLTATNMKLDTIIQILSMIANNSGSSSEVSYLDSETPAEHTELSNAQGSFDADYDAAVSQQQYIDSVVNFPALDSIQIDDNTYMVGEQFYGLWSDASGTTNPLILAMTISPVAIAVLAYIIFGKRV